VAIEADLSVALNLTVGAVPVSLRAHVDHSAQATDLIFDGSVSSVTLPLSDFLAAVTAEFGIDTGLPVELDLSAVLAYVVAQLRRRSSPPAGATITLLIAGHFELAVSGHSGQLSFYAYVTTTDPRPATTPFVIGAAFDTDLDFTNLPVVGSIPGLADLSLRQIGFSYANADPTASNQPQRFVIPTVTRTGTPDQPVYTITDLGGPALTVDHGGFSLTAALVNLRTGATQASFALPLAPPSTSAPGPPPLPQPRPGQPKPSAPASSASALPIRWVDVNKTFGPVNVQKIGVNYARGQASFGLSAGLALASFGLNLDGLAISFPLPLPGQPAGSTVAFDLAGLSLDFKRGGLELGAAFLRVNEGGHPAFYGEVIVKMANFGLKAIGGYTPASDAGPASFFIYASLNVPLGGPPFLFVTGFAAGFGINRSLVLPTLDNLGTYLLLPDNAPAQSDSAQDTVKTVIPQLQSIFQNEPGQYWVAAGISFTSFEMIDAFALVTVAFGVDMQIAVLGSCAMTFPKGSPYPVAFIQVNLLASFTPSSGLLAVIGELTPSSFVYGGLVHISGGFAFYIWVSGPHAGEFVVSVGGYHPAFARPAHYPAVPRLAMQFALGPMSVTGQAYFALTPAMMMAGLSLQAVWNSAGIRVWLTAGVDFLMAWAPFHYEASVYISLGCSIDLGLFTLELDVGAELMIYGPPFGGHADVDVDVASFTISFGAAAAAPAPVGWDEFRTGFLPRDTPGRSATAPAAVAARPTAATSAATQNIVNATVAAGLQQTDVAGLDWIVDPDRFAIVTNSAVPATAAQWLGPAGATDLPNSVAAFTGTRLDVSTHPFLSLQPDQPTASDTLVWNPSLGVRPMKALDVQSRHTITLTKRESGQPPVPITEVTVQPVLLDVSAAMWANTSAPPGANDPRLTPRSLVGLRITALKRHPATVDNVPLEILLYQRGYGSGYRFTSTPADDRYTIQLAATAPTILDLTVAGPTTISLTNAEFVLAALGNPWVADQRSAVVNELATIFGTRPVAQIDVSTMASATKLTDWPTIAVLAAPPSRRPASLA
jgi:hypothetical protein